MQTWDQFYPDVLPSVMGCPNPMVDRALLRAAQVFCSKTQVWKVWLADIATLALATEYVAVLPTTSELVKLERATLDGRPIIITAPEILPADWQTNPSGISDCIFTIDRKTITLLPAKPAGLLLRIEAVLKPSNTALGVEDHLFDQYSGTIAMLATAELLKLPDRPWGNPVYGQEMASLANEQMATISFQKLRAFASAIQRARINFF